MPAADGEALLRRLGGTNGILTGFVIGLLALLALLQVAGLASG
jgi:tetrahydromethanopterin S-methyltransferase subunit G